MIRREQFFKNCKPALIIAVKQIKKIDANKNRITALKAEAEAIMAELGMLNARPLAFAQA